MRSDQKPRTGKYGAVVIFLLLGVLAGAWHNRMKDRGRQDIVAGVTREVVAPPAGALAGISRWFGAQTGWLLRGPATAAENRRLRERVAELEGQNAALQEAQTKYVLMRDDLGFVRAEPKAMIAADVIARRPDSSLDTILISRGSRAGVHPHSIVRTRSGLVGQVSEVTPDTASVVLITNEAEGVGAMVQRGSSRAVGLCKGDFTRLIPLIDLPGDADVKVDDLVVTSGLGSVYPAGIAIGKVASIRPEEGSVSKAVRVRPLVDFDRLEAVYVLP